MANTQIEIIQHDTGFAVDGVLEDEDGILPLNGATVTFLMRPDPASGMSTPVVNAPADIVDSDAAEGDADYGRVRYEWASQDTAVAGLFRAQFRATWTDGRVEHAPSDGYIEVLIRADLA